MKYKEYKELNFAKVGEEILAFWKQEKIFEKSVSNREGKQTFTFYEGVHGELVLVAYRLSEPGHAQ